jgi:hypothetical protein
MSLVTRHIITIGAVLVVLKLLKAANFNRAVALTPFIILLSVKAAFFVWGYVMYHKKQNACPLF